MYIWWVTVAKYTKQEIILKIKVDIFITIVLVKHLQKFAKPWATFQKTHTNNLLFDQH